MAAEGDKIINFTLIIFYTEVFGVEILQSQPPQAIRESKNRSRM
jgi:hypothetical protein